MDQCLDERWRTLDKMCFSSQFFFVIVSTGWGFIFVVFGAQACVLNGYVPFFDYGIIGAIALAYVAYGVGVLSAQLVWRGTSLWRTHNEPWRSAHRQEDEEDEEFEEYEGYEDRGPSGGPMYSAMFDTKDDLKKDWSEDDGSVGALIDWVASVACLATALFVASAGVLPSLTCLIMVSICGLKGASVACELLGMVVATAVGAGLVVGFWALGYDIVVHNDKQPTWHYFVMAGIFIALVAAKIKRCLKHCRIKKHRCCRCLRRAFPWLRVSAATAAEPEIAPPCGPRGAPPRGGPPRG